MDFMRRALCLARMAGTRGTRRRGILIERRSLFHRSSFRLAANIDDPRTQLDFSGAYRLGRHGYLTLLIRDIKAARDHFSPEEKILYVTGVNPARAAWLVYDVLLDGTLANGRLLFDTTAWTRRKPWCRMASKLIATATCSAPARAECMYSSPTARAWAALKPAWPRRTPLGAITARCCTSPLPPRRIASGSRPVAQVSGGESMLLSDINHHGQPHSAWHVQRTARGHASMPAAATFCGPVTHHGEKK
jgi:hypothetical protein